MGQDVAIRKPVAPDAVFDGEFGDDQFESYDGVQLHPSEIAFVNAYVEGVGEARFSAAAAYRKVFPERRDVRKTASLWIKKPHIVKAVKQRLESEGLSAEAALAELATVALAEWRDLIDIKMRNGEIVSTRMDLASKVRALEIILRAHNRLDNRAAVTAAIQVNINTPGLTEDELA